MGNDYTYFGSCPSLSSSDHLTVLQLPNGVEVEGDEKIHFQNYAIEYIKKIHEKMGQVFCEGGAQELPDPSLKSIHCNTFIENTH